jgi:hypothetical protein
MYPPWLDQPDRPLGRGNRKGNRPSRGVFPPFRAQRFLADGPFSKGSESRGRLKSLPRWELPRLQSGGGLCRPLLFPCLEPQSQRQPWLSPNVEMRPLRNV